MVKKAKCMADGGIVKETPEQIMARMAEKYGTTGAAQAAPVQQPALPPQPKAQPLPQQKGIGSDIIGILKGRQAQIDKAIDYEEGGIVRGKGGVDNVPMEISGTKVNLTGGKLPEAVLPGKTVQALGGTAAVEALIEVTNGKPPVKDGLKEGGNYAVGAVDEENPLVKAFGPTVPTLGAGLSGMSRMIGEAGITGGSPIAQTGRDAAGIITSDSSKAAMAEPMQRSGGIFGTMDLADQNNRMAKSLGYAGADDFNRQQANRPAAAAGILGLGADGLTDIERQNEEKTRRWRQDDLISLAQRGNQGAIAAALNGDANYDAAKLRQTSDLRGQEVSANTSITNAGIADSSSARRDAVTMRGQDVTAANEAIRAGIDQKRLGIVESDSKRASDKWSIEKGIMQGQAADSEAQRTARGELNAALAAGDPGKIESAKAKAIAAGIKFDKPNNEYVTATDSMGMNITRTNKDTGAVDVIDGKSGKVKASIPSPGMQQAAQAPVPQGFTVVGTSGGKRVLQDAQGKRFVEGN